MSKYTFKTNDIYYPNTFVARNKLNIKDKKTIEEIEAFLLENAYSLYIPKAKNKEIILNEHFFKLLHKNIFQDLYEWAGVYRNFDMAKGDSLFCRGEFVEKEMKKIFELLQKDNYLVNLDKNEFINKLAYYKCELITIHPFYEINGRVIRLFIDLLCVYNGYNTIDYSNISKENYIECAIKCVQEVDFSCFEEIIRAGL